MLENVRESVERMLTKCITLLSINKQPTPNDVKVMCLDIKVLCLDIKYLDVKVYVSTSR